MMFRIIRSGSVFPLPPVSPLIVAPGSSTVVVVHRFFRTQFLPVDFVHFLEAPVNLT